MDDFIKTFKVLTDKNRVRMLKMLEQNELCVCEITSVLDITVSTVSSHLSMLADTGFITVRKEGKWVYAKLKKSSDNAVMHQLLAMIPGWLNSDEIISTDLIKVRNLDKEKLCKT
ncbi:MAG: metalloregulator ArsR/SmtB family transcription factor [Candidatus Kapaibacterium sp.]|jgi:DNA-binding transcriptional ArsR family regulator